MRDEKGVYIKKERIYFGSSEKKKTKYVTLILKKNYDRIRESFVGIL